jgi:cyclopropane-fatty-acyl-phospholipid synthase
MPFNALPFDSLVMAAVLVTATMAGLWLLSLRHRNFSYVDVGWAANFALLAVLYSYLGTGAALRRGLICGMFLLWSLRLSLHLYARIRGKPEEGRYQALRTAWAGPSLNLKFLGFFGAQGLLNLLLSLPMLLAMNNSAPEISTLEWAGAGLWVLALVGEGSADRQLAQFKRAPGNAGKICEQGWWRYSRHPNYFFEWLIWVAYALFALGSPFGWLALLCPALMLYLLLQVTGVKPTEAQSLRSRGAAYRDYQARVSAFVPWPRISLAGSVLAITLVEHGLVPDVLIRRGIRRLLAQRLREENEGDLERQQARLQRFVQQLRDSPVAIHTAAANEQHYELPPPFFQAVLGKHLKYSSGYYEPGTASLDVAEEAMLGITVQRACLKDGDRILELGCGWGSLTLFMAARFPHSRIAAVSNSRPQREYILARAAERGLLNIEVLTCDANVLDFPSTTHFDRIVSVEMFEHLRNYQTLFTRMGRWLKPGGTLFVHIFTHREYAYAFEARDSSDWMARYFFTGGIMPSDSLLLYFQHPLKIESHWRVDGRHYQKTAEAWLANMDRNHAIVTPLLEQTYGVAAAKRWRMYWRVFFMSCAELWGYAGGREWFVSHYLFRNPE